MIIEFPLGQWLPDAPDFKNPGCEVADNVIPTTNGYGPLRSLTGQSETVTSAVRGAKQLFDNSGNSLIVGGMDDRLFIRRSSIMETSGMSSVGTDEAWDFAQFNDFVFATAANNAPQYLTDIDSDNTWSAVPGSPPNAKRCAKVAEFLMLGNISGAPNRIQWSAYNNPAGSWAASRLTQAGSVDLPMEYGDVQKIVGGRYALVFQERGITRLTYVGPPTVWRADVISQDRGALAPHSVVTVGYISYFLAQDGFYSTDGASVTPIGGRRVNEWFFNNVNQGQINQAHGAVDWQNECIFWAIYGDGASSYTRMLTYSYAQNSWASATVSLDWLVGSTLDGVDLDSLDAIYTNLDNITVSLDSDEFKAKDRWLAAFVANEYSTFTGSAARATWETGEMQPSPARRAYVRAVTPVLQADEWDSEVTLLMRDNRGAQTLSPKAVTGWDGSASVRGEGQKMAVRVVKPGGTWKDATAVQVDFEAAGYR